jgi:hypothetical protein
MHAANTKVSTIIALLMTLVVGAAASQTIAPASEPARMPGSNCPPNC